MVLLEWSFSGALMWSLPVMVSWFGALTYNPDRNYLGVFSGGWSELQEEGEEEKKKNKQKQKKNNNKKNKIT